MLTKEWIAAGQWRRCPQELHIDQDEKPFAIVERVHTPKPQEAIMSNRNIIVALLSLGFAASVQAEVAVRAIAAGYAVLADGTVWTLWGPGPAPVRVPGLSGIVAIDAGVALKEDGTVWVWGWGCYPAPAPVTQELPTTACRVTGLDGVIAIASGSPALALKGDGTVWEFGTGPADPPVQVSGLSGITAVAAGGSHRLALKGDGTVWAWGTNKYGELGDGTTTDHSTPSQVSGLDGVRAVAAGATHSLALKEDGTVWAWGANWQGQLGDESFMNRATPVRVSGLSEVAAIAAGVSDSVALGADGTVWAWGGDGGATCCPTSAAAQMAGLSGVVAVAPGFALKRDGTIWAWGINSLGLRATYRSTRIQVNGISGITAVAAGGAHSLALKADGTVWAWGVNDYGQLGDGTTTDRSAPDLVSGLDAVRAIRAGSEHSLALREDGTVWAWGLSQCGWLADGHAIPCTTPAQVSGLSNVVAIATGGYIGGLNLAVKTDGTVWVWPSPDNGRPWRIVPVQVSGLSDVVAAASGRMLALKKDGTVWEWRGWSFDSQLDASQLPPAEVSELSGVVALASGDGPGLVAKDDGTAWQWADPYPTQVNGLGGVRALAEAFYDWSGHRLALKRDGTVWEWGFAYGPYPPPPWTDGAATVGTTPRQVGGLSAVVAIAAGAFHSLAVKRDGTVWGWGSDSSGQLGYESNLHQTTPVQVIPPGSPDLAITMRHEGDFTVGGHGVYTLTLTNTGLLPTAGTVTVTDSLPPGLTYVSGAGTGWSCSAEDQEVTCTSPGPVGPGASTTITLTVEVGPAASPGLTTLATVSNQSDLNRSNNIVCDPTVVMP